MLISENWLNLSYMQYRLSSDRETAFHKIPAGLYKDLQNGSNGFSMINGLVTYPG